MLNASRTFALNINECADSIQYLGPKRTVIVRGPMGWGKSSLLKLLAARLGEAYTYVYFDCTTKMDTADLHLANFMQTPDGRQYVRYVPVEEFGLHLGKPIVLNIDEIGKAEKSVKAALMRDLLERHRFPAGSIVFGTTNLSAERLGDLLMAHHRNRLDVVDMRNSTQEEWIEGFAYEANIHPSVIGWCSEHPEIFQCFTDLMDAKGDISKAARESNPMIHIPGDVDREAFVTGRSLEAASDVLHTLDGRVTERVVTAHLIGTIGPAAAMSLMAYHKMASELPRLADIKQRPLECPVPTHPAALCMTVHRTLSVIERNWMDSWMDYLLRLPVTAQGLFAMVAKKATYHKQPVVLGNAKFQHWALTNNYLTAQDKI